MPKKRKINNCGECKSCDSLTFTLKGYERKCMETYTDEKKTEWRWIPDWREIPGWCPLEDW